jgi:hypothetical protein
MALSQRSLMRAVCPLPTSFSPHPHALSIADPRARMCTAARWSEDEHVSRDGFAAEMDPLRLRRNFAYFADVIGHLPQFEMRLEWESAAAEGEEKKGPSPSPVPSFRLMLWDDAASRSLVLAEVGGGMACEGLTERTQNKSATLSVGAERKLTVRIDRANERVSVWMGSAQLSGVRVDDIARCGLFFCCYRLTMTARLLP